MNNLWYSVGNQCLTAADNILKQKTIPTWDDAEIVARLVSIAITIDDLLNLRWDQSRCASAAGRVFASAQQPRGSSTD